MRKCFGLFLLVVSLLCFFSFQESNGADSLGTSYVNSFDIYPREVKISDNPVDITFTLNFADANNESGSKILPLQKEPQALFRNTVPNSNQNIIVNFFKQKTNGVYVGSARIVNESYHGLWVLDNLRLTDRNMNILDLKNELEKDKFPMDFVVKQSGFRSIIFGSIGLGVLVLLIMSALYWWWSGGKWPNHIYRSDDSGASSASKAQLLLWTVVAIFSYTVIYADRVLNHNTFDVPTEIPSNLLVAMGLSAGTTLAAKVVSGTQIRSGKAQKQEEDSKGGILLNDDGEPDLSKIQMMAWTFLAVGVYLISVLKVISISFQVPDLPDINPTLLALMGIGEIAYVGKKAVTEDDPRAPRLSTISPERGSIGSEVILTGLNFGEEQGGSQILFDGKPIPEIPKNDWGNTQIKFKIPDEVAGEKMAPRKTEVSLMVKDKQSPNPKVLEVIDPEAPYLDGVDPSKGPVGSDVILTGLNFGDNQDTGQILIDGDSVEKSDITKWIDTEIRFKIPAEIAGTKLTPPPLKSKMINISLKVNGIESQNTKPFEVERDN